MNLEQSIKLKRKLLGFLNEHDEEELRNKGYDFLDKNLGLTESNITQKDVESLIYARFKPFSFEDKLLSDDALNHLKRRIQDDEKALQRIGVIAKKPVTEMNEDELKETAFQVLRTDLEKYKEKIRNSKAGFVGGGGREDVYSSKYQDLLTIVNILEQHYKEFDPSQLKQRILSEEYPEFEYFEGYFKGIFDYFTPRRSLSIMSCIDQFQQNYTDALKLQEKLEIMDKTLSAQHKMEPPEHFLKIATPNLKPIRINYNKDGKLIVLSFEKEENDLGELVLSSYDNEGNLVNETTNLKDLSGGWGTDWVFKGNLSVGSNNLIYVHGGEKVFDSDLNIVEEDNLARATELLKKEGFLKNQHVFDVQEEEGIFYFLALPRFNSSHYDGGLIITDGKKIISAASFSPVMGYNTSENPNPELVIGKEKLYLKVENAIISLDKDFSEGAVKDASVILSENKQLETFSTPSNICLSPKNNLYAVTRHRGERNFQSIKAYSLKPGREGEFLTHIYPRNHPGGWAALRSMAISPEGILAYSSFNGATGVDLYKLKE